MVGVIIESPVEFTLTAHTIFNNIVTHPSYVYSELKLEFFSVKTQHYYLTNQLHVPVAVF